MAKNLHQCTIRWKTEPETNDPLIKASRNYIKVEFEGTALYSDIPDYMSADTMLKWMEKNGTEKQKNKLKSLHEKTGSESETIHEFNRLSDGLWHMSNKMRNYCATDINLESDDGYCMIYCKENPNEKMCKIAGNLGFL
ncbi:MAG: hypothetical protein NT038_09215 [Euryarchaeota archaeon]|nr:hypothetical protein [Euryarchaeota archaeon]